MSVTFRDESNEPRSTMIVYSDSTVTTPNHPIIVRSKASLATLLLQYHSCRGYFVIRFYLIPLISGQSMKKANQTRPKGLQCWTMHGRPCAVQKPNKEEQWIWSYSLTTETVSRCPFLSFRGESYTHNAQNLQRPELWRPTFWLHCELIKLHSVRNKLE